MEFKNHIYNLNTMKKTILFLFSIVIFSGCSTPTYKKIELGEPGNYEKIKRGYVNYRGSLNPASLNDSIPDVIKKQIEEFCYEKYKITAIEKKPYIDSQYWFFFIIPWITYSNYNNEINLIHFECINEKK